MAIYHKGRTFQAFAYGGRTLAAIYQAGEIVWQAVRSCFGSGVWISRKPWIGAERWKNN